VNQKSKVLSCQSPVFQLSISSFRFYSFDLQISISRFPLLEAQTAVYSLVFPVDSHPSMTYNENVSAAIAYTSVYEKRVGKILRADERDAMELHVANNPESHPVVAGTGGVRKARWGRQGKGKRGGVRVIYFYRFTPDVVYFLDIYAKSAKENLTPADKVLLRELVNRLKGVQ